MMNKLLIVLLLATATYAQSKAAPFTPYAGLSKAEQKQRLKSPAIVEIAAPASKVSQLLVRSLQTEGYQVTQSTAQSLSMTKDMKSTGASILGAMIGEGGFQFVVSYTFSEIDGITTVSGDAWLLSQNAYGRQTRQSLLNKKKHREGLDWILAMAKATAELDPQQVTAP